MSETPTLSRDEVRALLRECVTVVKPGEVLFFTVGDPNSTPGHIREIQEFINWWLDLYAPEVKVLVLPYGEMAAAEPEADEAFAERVGRVMPDILRREMRKQAANTIRV